MGMLLAVVALLALAAYLFGPPRKARAFAIKRLLLLVVYFVFAFFVIAAFVELAPGDPVDAIAGPSASEEVRERVRAQHGLDRPFFTRNIETLGNWMHGDFGESFRERGKPVTEAVFDRMPVSAALMFVYTTIACVLGIAAGLLATLRKGTIWDSPFLMSLLVFSVIPSLILIQFLILILAIWAGWLPAGWTGNWQAVFSKTSIIPGLTIVLTSVAGIAFFVRATSLKVMDEQHVLAAKAKGLSDTGIMTKHVMRRVSLPLVTSFLPLLLNAFTGSFFIERIYGIPGLAVYTLEAVFARDYPVILFVGVWGYVFALFVRILADVTLFKLDRSIQQ